MLVFFTLPESRPIRNPGTRLLSFPAHQFDELFLKCFKLRVLRMKPFQNAFDVVTLLQRFQKGARVFKAFRVVQAVAGF